MVHGIFQAQQIMEQLQRSITEPTKLSVVIDNGEQEIILEDVVVDPTRNTVQLLDMLQEEISTLETNRLKEKSFTKKSIGNSTMNEKHCRKWNQDKTNLLEKIEGFSFLDSQLARKEEAYGRKIYGFTICRSRKRITFSRRYSL